LTSIDSLVDALGARISAFAAGDPGPILQPRAAAEARELAVRMLSGGPGMQKRAVVAVALLHWYRCLAAPKPDDHDAESAILWWSVVAETDPQAVPEALRPVVIANVERIASVEKVERAVELLRQGTQTRDRTSLDNAIDDVIEAVDKVSADAPVRLDWLTVLGRALIARFELAGLDRDLDTGFTVLQQAVEGTPPGDSAIAVRLSNLGVAFFIRYQQAGASADLDSALQVTRRAVRATAPDVPELAGHLGNLANVLVTQFLRTSALTDLDEAVSLLRTALALECAAPSERRLHLSNLGGALQALFDATGATASLDEAIETLRKASDLAAAGSPDRAAVVGNLGGALGQRYELVGAVEDLLDSIRFGREAVDLTPLGNPDRPKVLSNLAGRLQRLYLRSKDPAQLHEAIGMIRTAVDLTPPDHPSLPIHLATFALLLATSLGDAEPADLDAAATAIEQAQRITPDDHPDRAEQMATSTTPWMARYHRTGTVSDLDQAIQAIRRATAMTPVDQPRRVRHLSILGQLLLRPPGGLHEAIGVLSEASRSAGAPTSVRLPAAQAWALAIAYLRGLPAALPPYTAAVELLGLLAWRGVGHRNQLHLLSTGPTHLARDGSACAAAAMRPDLAVQLLESGRMLTWSQLLETRSDLAALRQASPRLAERLDRCRNRLESLE
jgi:tetratricopeptide (TPR) repeat protein